MKIKCSTLFDITSTNVSNFRYIPNQDTVLDKMRNQQRNFETILQIISMRCQPEDITEPIKNQGKNHIFGSIYKKVTYWEFEFSIFQTGVFHHENNSLGKLFLDCAGVPMISNLEEGQINSSTLDISDKLKNIHFEVLNET